MTDVSIFDDCSQSTVTVTTNGELVVSPIAHSVPHYVSVALADTAYEVVPAKSGKKFIVTAMILASSKTFGSATTAETLTIYEASPADLDTNTRTLTQLDLLKNDRLVATSLNFATNTAVSLVAIATDDKVNVTIAGYYISNGNG